MNMKQSKRFTNMPLHRMACMAIVYDDVREHFNGRATFDHDPDYLMHRVEVAKRERELQRAHMCAFDPTRVKPEQVIHLDYNVLRIWPDMGIAELIKFYTYKAEIMREFAAARWATGERYGAHHFKLERRKYEQALIKLKRERDRRKRVYNLS